ncbi:MAG TPA: metal ABC transporter ATP-binding protein [Halomicronema sp.]
MSNFNLSDSWQIGALNVPILKVSDLTVYQGNYTALNNVSFELQRGTDTAVVGPNGAGKSTLVRAILGLMNRSSGNIKIFGRSLEKLGNLAHQIGYVPQNFLFDRSFPLSVSELVALGWVKEKTKTIGKLNIQNIVKLCLSFQETWQKNPEKEIAVKIALQRVDAYHLRNQAIGTLSGGQLKRVLLAYCLVMQRQLLVLDEAFAGVDAQGEAEFYSLLNELKTEQNWTVLQVSHDLDMVSRHCDRVICLNQSIVCTGTPEIALSTQNLLATYGPAFSRYYHKH